MKNITLANGTTLGPVTPKAKKPKINGVVLFEGASQLDGAPIVVIATLSTSNVKTGDMVQTWIIRSDLSPLDASKEGKDDSICGRCPHRRNLGGACYVTLHQAPRSIYAAYKKGSYPKFNINEHANLLKGRSIRLGAYGDPAAVSWLVWDYVKRLAKNVTGYTHQIKHPNFNKKIANYCMISADTEKQAQKIHKEGYKTFRVKTESQPLLENEIECLADSKGLTCLECGLCDGSKANVVINVHGQLKSRYNKKFETIQVININ